MTKEENRYHLQHTIEKEDEEKTNPVAAKTLTTYCTQWLTIQQSRLKESTLAKYHIILENHIHPFLGNYRISELNSTTIAEFSHVLLYQKKLAVKTVRDILTFLHEIIVYTEKETGINLSHITISYPKLEWKELRVLSREEQQYFVEYLFRQIDHYKFSVLLALLTGLRIGEICALQWKDVSLESGYLTVNHTVQRIRNPDRSSAGKTILLFGTPKTVSSIRTIPITDRLNRLFRLFQTDDPSAFVITGNRQLTDPRKLQRKLKKYTDETGLQEIHFHTLRHTFATRCVECGCDTKTLSEILGHANIATTMNRYVHPSLEFKRKNLIKMEQAGLFPPLIEDSAMVLGSDTEQ